MKPPDVFGIIVRTVGLLLLLFGLLNFLGAIATAISPQLSRGGTAGYYVGIGTVVVFVAAYFLSGAPRLVDFAYGPEDAERENEPSTKQE